MTLNTVRPANPAKVRIVWLPMRMIKYDLESLTTTSLGSKHVPKCWPIDLNQWYPKYEQVKFLWTSCQPIYWMCRQKKHSLRETVNKLRLFQQPLSQWARYFYQIGMYIQDYISHSRIFTLWQRKVLKSHFQNGFFTSFHTAEVYISPRPHLQQNKACSCVAITSRLICLYILLIQKKSMIYFFSIYIFIYRINSAKALRTAVNLRRLCFPWVYLEHSTKAFLVILGMDHGSKQMDEGVVILKKKIK